jgi:hypothetical protein
VSFFVVIWCVSSSYTGCTVVVFGLCRRSGTCSLCGSSCGLNSSANLTGVVQWLRLTLSKGPNWVGVFSPPSPEDGNGCSFRNVVFLLSKTPDGGKVPKPSNSVCRNNCFQNVCTLVHYICILYIYILWHGDPLLRNIFLTRANGISANRCSLHGPRDSCVTQQ